MTSPSSFSPVQIGLHWVVAVLVGYEILFSEVAASRWSQRMSGLIPNEPAANPHAVVGLVVLALTLVRLGLRFGRGAPPPPPHESRVVAAVRRATVLGFYGLLIGIPATGFLQWLTGVELPAEVHCVTADILVGLIGLHVVAALWHHFWLRSDVLLRMVPGGRRHPR
jgi:cytochrome b561